MGFKKRDKLCPILIFNLGSSINLNMIKINRKTKIPTIVQYIYALAMLSGSLKRLGINLIFFAF